MNLICNKWDLDLTVYCIINALVSIRGGPKRLEKRYKKWSGGDLSKIDFVILLIKYT